MRKKRAKRTLTQEQIQKMQAGRARSLEAKRKSETVHKQVAMLSDLEKRLANGAKEKPIRIPKRRRHF